MHKSGAACQKLADRKRVRASRRSRTAAALPPVRTASRTDASNLPLLGVAGGGATASRAILSSRPSLSHALSALSFVTTCGKRGGVWAQQLHDAPLTSDERACSIVGRLRASADQQARMMSAS